MVSFNDWVVLSAPNELEFTLHQLQQYLVFADPEIVYLSSLK